MSDDRRVLIAERDAALKLVATLRVERDAAHARDKRDTAQWESAEIERASLRAEVERLTRENSELLESHHKWLSHEHDIQVELATSERYRKALEEIADGAGDPDQHAHAALEGT